MYRRLFIILHLSWLEVKITQELLNYEEELKLEEVKLAPNTAQRQTKYMTTVRKRQKSDKNKHIWNVTF